MKSRIFFPLVGVALAILAVPPNAFSQQKEATSSNPSGEEVQALKARIEVLESQNQAIVKQNEAMMKLLNELKAKLEGPPQAVNASASSAASISTGDFSTRPTFDQPSSPAPDSMLATAPASAPAATTANGGSANAASTSSSQEQEAPLSLRIGRASVTPVGFVDFTSVFRSTNTGNGMPTSFGSIPFGNTPAGHLTELRLSSQNSQPGLRVDVDVANAHVTGYLLLDFLGQPAPGNLVSSTNGNGARLREAYVDVRKDKFEFVGGQAWSLLTPNRRGLGPEHRDLFYGEKNLDPNEQLGLVWQRASGVRFIYNASDSVAIGLALENPDQYIGGSGGGGTIVLPSALAATYGTELDNTSNSLAVPNLHPDIIAKIAFDPMIGDRLFHIEFAGLDSSFKVFNPLTKETFTANGGGGAINFNFELFKHFHLLSNNFYGDGGGRYLFGQAPDLIVRGDGSISLVHSGSTLDGFEAQVAPKTVLYSYYGLVYIQRDIAHDPATGGLIGYGFPGSPSSNNRVLHEPTFGINQTIWRDAKYGALQFALQYSYLIRHPWAVAPAAPTSANLNMVYVGLRYFLPGEAPKLGK